MKFEFDGQVYPLIVRAGDGADISEIIDTIAPDENGDYCIFRMCSLDGVGILDTVSASRVKILIELNALLTQ